jgi:hypothetical protein
MIPLAPLWHILFHLVSNFDLTKRGDNFLSLKLLLLGAALDIELILDVFIHDSLYMSTREHLKLGSERLVCCQHARMLISPALPGVLRDGRSDALQGRSGRL